MKKLILMAMIACLAACGVKSDLVKPDGQPTSKNERDPSLPPTTTSTRP